MVIRRGILIVAVVTFMGCALPAPRCVFEPLPVPPKVKVHYHDDEATLSKSDWQQVKAYTDTLRQTYEKAVVGCTTQRK